MHVNVQLRNNSQTGDRAPYYRLKESYRDVRGNVHSLIVLNIGFESNLSPASMRRIAVALTEIYVDTQRNAGLCLAQVSYEKNE